MVQVTVKKGTEEKSYKLEDLLELQNKLMLMSSKGEHGREQVNRFSEVSGIYKTNKFRAECESFCTVNRFVRSVYIFGRFLKEFRDWAPFFFRCKHLATCSSENGKQRFTAPHNSKRASKLAFYP